MFLAEAKVRVCDTVEVWKPIRRVGVVENLLLSGPRDTSQGVSCLTPEAVQTRSRHTPVRDALRPTFSPRV